MQKLNSLLIVVLLALVGYLLFDKFSSSKPSQEDTTKVVQEEVIEEGLIGEGEIAFINIDSLNAQFKFLKDKQKVLEQEQSRSERAMANKMKKAEQDYIKLQEDAQFMVPSQLEEAQIKLQNMQVEIESLRERLATKLFELESSIQNELNQRIQDQVSKVNAELGYDYILAKSANGGILHGKEAFDITARVIEGLNSEYEAELAAGDSED